MREGDWQAVGAEVRQRMTARKITTAELARRTALSQATIRSVRAGKAAHEGITLVTLAAGLGWPLQYLREVAAGMPPSPPPVAPVARVERKLDALLAYFEVTVS